jgi:superfamily I DNA/RNA helicase
MNNLKTPEFIPGPPGTGKTHRWLKKNYANFLKKYPWERIVVLSHTVLAAKEIIKAVKNLPEIKDISEARLEEQICTIHSYFRGEYLPLEKYDVEEHVKFSDQNKSMNVWNKPKWEKHPVYEYNSHAHGKGLSLEKYWRVCTPSRYHPYSKDGLFKLINKYDKFRDKHKKLSFEDMIDNFLFKAETPEDIDILIVDEAQDCSKPQIKALQKAATNAIKFIFIGDPDQTIHEYAGSDPEFFYKLADSKEAKDNELTEGLRCGQTINKICKNIISPVWKKYGSNAKRIWTPTSVVGKSYWIPSLEQTCAARDTLINKILNTNETFLFTYRGNPTHKKISEFFIDNGIDYQSLSNHPHVSREHFRCFKTWKTFLDDKVSKTQIMKYWPLIGKTVKVHGKGSVDHLKPLTNKDYNIQELINMGFILESAKKFTKFSQVLTNKTLLEKVPFILKVINNGMDTENPPRVKYDTIHKVKGLTFDNVVVDLSIYRPEPLNFEPVRLAYVAYSRGKTDCWSIGSSSPSRVSLAGIQNNRREILEL